MGTNGRAVSLEQFTAEILKCCDNTRVIVAIVGAPASGKSSSVEALKTLLEDQMQLKTQVIPMDGFHYDNAILESFGLIKRKGSPDTFDVDGLLTCLARLRQAFDVCDVAIPVFDRSMELSRSSARLIRQDTNVLLVEGNYLLLNQEPWSHLREYFNLTAMINCPMGTLRSRLFDRWASYQFSDAEIREKVECNDLINAQTVIENSCVADFLLSTER